MYVYHGKIRKLSGYESLLLQGFPEEIAIKVKENNLSNNMILSQAGNAMTTSVIKEVASKMLEATKGIK
ncbi:DNA cytosine methyltransferase [Mycoplasmopsis sturni]|uniref:DNA cytosine methyltransferase n=1 Tax=Mycoplasmopsis sturni TaxID=39047 RepID=UPI002481767C|nr:DNA cytosine methyltransferase [Mycoplasmopsis sturni]